MTSRLLKSAIVTIPTIFLSTNVFSAEEEKKETSIEPIDFTTYRAIDTPVNYSYIALNLGKDDYDNFDPSVTTAGLRGQVLLNERYIFKMGYETSLLDKDNAGNDLSYQSSVFGMGIGLRQAIFKTTDIEFDAHVLYNWRDNDQTNKSEQELGYKVGAYINQGIGDSFEGTLGVNYVSEYSQESFNFLLSGTQYITEYVGLGLDGKLSNRSSSTFTGDLLYVGVHLRLAFY
ncbi:hypothetical protein E2R68_13055 [Psychromonas sp. RZ22]|uniref:hypothetical protein n=1 Tax=Psychromonas algarum TaxID=2555643 RepID=UPI001067BFA9|nr:hypothetical protein [Psychromonas sp. RZ22]TEW53327.1 hypothetical protein E2R68_13055 [Psychromonas sp. RZ22]